MKKTAICRAFKKTTSNAVSAVFHNSVPSSVVKLG